MQRTHRIVIIALLVLLVTPIPILIAGEEGELVIRPKPLQRPEENPRYLREHSPVVSIKLVEEHEEEVLVTFSMRGGDEPRPVEIVRRPSSEPSEEAIQRFSIARERCAGLEEHLEAFGSLEIPAVLDEVMYFPAHTLKIWVTTLSNEMRLSLRIPPVDRECPSCSAPTASILQKELIDWTRELIHIIGAQNCDAMTRSSRDAQADSLKQ